MPRPDPRRPRDGQQGLFGDDPATPALARRHAQATERALVAARDQGLITAADEALVAAIRAGAHAFDLHESQNSAWGAAKLIEPFVGALDRAHMTPEARRALNEATAKNFEELVRGLAAPDGPATARDAAQS